MTPRDVFPSVPFGVMCGSLRLRFAPGIVRLVPLGSELVPCGSIFWFDLVLTVSQ